MIILKYFLILFLTGRTSLCQDLSFRIVGGDDTPIERAPYTVSIQNSSFAYCGGSILNHYSIVSAAHCFIYETIYVRAGSSYPYSGGMLIRAERMLPHPLYNNETKGYYDVGIVWLEEPLVYNAAIQPIDIVPAGHVTPPGTLAFVTGWGLLKEKTRLLPKVMQGVAVPVVSQEQCIEYYKYSEYTNSSICAGYEEGGKDACRYDSGGPLVVDGKLIAAVNNGVGCARPRFPGVYVNLAIPSVRAWVYENLKPDPIS